LFGWLAGAALSWSSSMIGAALCFWIAGSLGRPVAERLIGDTRALDAADAFFSRQGARAVLVARLIPFLSFRAVSYAAGLTPMPMTRFLIATGIGQAPATLLYSYFGGQLVHSVQILFWAASLTLALAVAGSALAAGLPRGRAARAEAAARSAASPDRLDPLGDLGAGEPREVESKADDFRHRHMREQRVGPENHGDLALRRRRVGDAATVDADHARGHVLKP
jgi:membrane protein DedA with SNARE-associated domain